MDAEARRALFEAQQRTAALLVEREPDDDEALHEAGTILAGTLRALVGDEQVWDDLSEANRRLQSTPREQLRLLSQVDWLAVLETAHYQPPPPLEWSAWELADLVAAAIASPDEDSAQELRKYLDWLAGRLEGQLAEPASTWGARFRRRLSQMVGHAFNVVRRVHLGELVFEALKEGAGAAAKGSAPFLFGAPPELSLAITAAAALAGTGKALLVELRTAHERYEDEVTAEEERRTAELLDALIGEMFRVAQPGRIGGLKADFKTAAAAVAEAGGDSWIAKVGQRATDLAILVGALLPSAWSYLLAHLGPLALEPVEAVAAAVARLRVALFDLQAADGAAIPKRVEAVIKALGDLEAAVHELHRVLIDRGLVPH